MNLARPLDPLEQQLRSMQYLDPSANMHLMSQPKSSPMLKQ